MTFIKNFIKDEDGVTAIEYALIAALIAGVIAAGATTLGTNVNDLFKALATKIKGTA
jgi:pilus assembly protein Flp/PilA